MPSEVPSMLAQNTIYIGRISLDADTEVLRTVLTKFGTIQEFKHMRARNDKQAIITKQNNQEI